MSQLVFAYLHLLVTIAAGVPTAWSAQGGPTHSRGLTLVSGFILIYSSIFNTGYPDTNERAEQVRVAL